MRTTLAVLASLLAASAGHADDVLVGVLEHEFLRGSRGRSDEVARLRVPFKHTVSGWDAMPHEAPDQEALQSLPAAYPAEANWTIAFDGRSIGTVRTRRKEQYEYYGEVGLVEVIGKDVPKVGVASAHSPFALEDGESAYRSLVAVSNGHFNDPDLWKREQPSVETLSLALAALRKQLPTVVPCSRSGGVLPPRKYADDEVKTVESHRSNDGAHVVSLLIVPRRAVTCESGDSPDADTLSHTFGIAASGKVTFLGTALALVDAGDYDGDGRSELIFFRSESDNHEGYLLVANQFQKRIEFNWNYH
jgi:hypothetical protein